jgi:hypothetical protein
MNGEYNVNSQQYEARHIEKILGISKNKLFFWMKTYELIKPDIEQGIGTGNRNRFSKKNILEFAIIKELVSWGIDLHTIKKIKNTIDRTKIISWEKGGIIYNNKPEGPGDYTEKAVGYYDWAFSGSFDVGMNIFRKENDKGESVWTVQWEWTDRPVSEEKVRSLFGQPTLLYMNVSLIARKLQDRLA